MAASNPGASPPRGRQEERSDETRSLLIQATLRLLLDGGFTRLTTADVARAAGVSRGALTHHFSNKEDLVTRAIAHQLQAVTAELRRFVDGGAVGPGGTDAILDYLWAMMSDGLFYVTLEYLPEARHNPGFRDRLIPVVQEFHAALDSIWMHLSEHTGLPPQRAKVILNTTMCLIRGMVAQSILRADPAYYRDILAYWKEQLRAETETSTSRGETTTLAARATPRRPKGGKKIVERR